jgi:hypothetical protein
MGRLDKTESVGETLMVRFEQVSKLPHPALKRLE